MEVSVHWYWERLEELLVFEEQSIKDIAIKAQIVLYGFIVLVIPAVKAGLLAWDWLQIKLVAMLMKIHPANSAGKTSLILDFYGADEAFHIISQFPLKFQI